MIKHGSFVSTIHYIQKWLNSNNLDVLLVPRNDRFQGEYTQLRDNRIGWLTNFSGSAGLCIVTQHSAALFVDGRYTLQAESEVNTQEITILPYNNASIQNWFNTKLNSPIKLAFDPWLISVDQLKNWKQLLSNQTSFVDLNDNPIDIIWNNQPPQITFDISHLPYEYSGRLSENKINCFIKIINSYKADAYIISDTDSISWLLNIRSNAIKHTPTIHGFLIIEKTGEVHLFSHSNNQQNRYFDNIYVNFRPEDELLDFLKNFHGSMAFDGLTLPVIVNEKLPKKSMNLKDPSIILRAKKNIIQQKGMENCHIRDGLALTQFLAWLDCTVKNGTNITEIDAENKLLEFRKQQNLFMGESFPTIAAVDAHGAIVHYRAIEKTNSLITRKSIFLLDSGGQYLDGTTDVTRTIAFGNPSDIQKQMFTRVLKGHIALSMAIFPKGTTGIQLDILARQYLWEIGCDYAHGTGHGVGSYLNVHEGPQSITKRYNNIPLEIGMVLSNEPGYYKEGEYGIRIENLMMVLQHPHFPEMLHFKNLTYAPIDIKFIDTHLLTSVEIHWINSYHREIFEMFDTKIKNENDRLWLKNNTKAIKQGCEIP